jgi:predicted secreted protein
VPAPAFALIRSCVLLALAGWLLAAPGAASAEDMPSFRQGLWEYQRTAGTNRYAATECIDPGEDLRRQQTVLQKLGCKLAPTTRAGSTWTYGADCTVQLPSGFVAFSTASLLTADSDVAYQVETRTTRRGATATETITAHRVADCAK